MLLFLFLFFSLTTVRDTSRNTSVAELRLAERLDPISGGLARLA